jgi:hypothetical protein
VKTRLYAFTVGICLYTQVDWMFSHQYFSFALFRIAGSLVLGWALARWIVLPVAAALKIGERIGSVCDQGDSFCPLFALWMGPVLSCRALALWWYGIDSLTAVEPSFGGISRGILSEAAFVALLALAFRKVGGLAFRYGTFAFFVVTAALNLEHLRVNASHASIFDAGNVLDRSFLFGTVLSYSVLLKVLLILPLSVVIALTIWAAFGCSDNRFMTVSLLGKELGLRGVMVFSMITLAVVFPGRYFYPKWVSQGLVEYNVRSVVDRLAFSSATGSLEVDVRRALQEDFFSSDLSGRLVAERPEKRPNILFVVLEGISYGTMKELMPYLVSYANENTSYRRFITQQRQTNRGLYSLLCGDYPNLLAKRPKTDHLILYPNARDCLPARLRRDGGYRTSYIQAARLEFMRKDKFTKVMGFDRSLGSEDLTTSPHSNRWGLDDVSLMGQVVDEVRRLDSEEGPWFVTVLTVGTHHPYNAPELLVPGYDDAVKHTDKAFLHLLDGLRREGLDDNLLVIITTDEAVSRHHQNAPFGLDQNHGILIVSHEMLPKNLVMHNVFTQSDLMISLLDFLQIESTGTMGRSIFRKYPENTRSTLFANAYADRFFILEGKRISICNSSMECRSGVFPNGIFLPGVFQSEAVSEDLRQRGTAIVHMNDAVVF